MCFSKIHKIQFVELKHEFRMLKNKSKKQKSQKRLRMPNRIIWMLTTKQPQREPQLSDNQCKMGLLISNIAHSAYETDQSHRKKHIVHGLKMRQEFL